MAAEQPPFLRPRFAKDSLKAMPGRNATQRWARHTFFTNYTTQKFGCFSLRLSLLATRKGSLPGARLSMSDQFLRLAASGAISVGAGHRS